ncbi:MAG: RodZ domain-containing protein [Pseudomonadales bacterium]
MSVDESLELESPAAVKRPSELLAEARQRLGLSQKEVADKLYLTTSFIKYIDAGEFSSLPKPAFIKGYLRSYARVVDLSGDEIVALYDAELQIAEPTPEIRGVTEEDVGTASITGPVLQIGLIGLGGLALVVAVIWWIVSDPEEETPLSVAQPGVSQPATQDSSEAVFDFVLLPQEGAALQSEQVSQAQAVQDQTGLESQVAMTETLRTIDTVEQALAETVAESREVSAIPVTEESIQEAATGQSISGQSISGQSTSEQSTSGQSTSEQSTSEQDSPGVVAVADSVKFERTTDGARSFITVDASGFDQLELSFRDECWVEIADNQFGLIYNDLNQVNDVLTIYGTAPFKVLLGKATGVEMIYNGRPFELEPFINRDRTAKLTVPN